MESPEKQKQRRFIWSPSSPRLRPSAYNAEVPLASLRRWYVWWMMSSLMFVRWASPSSASLCLTATLQASIRQHPTVHVRKGPSRNLQTWWFFVIIIRITTIIPEMAVFLSFCEKLKCCLSNSDILLWWNWDVWTVRLFSLTLTCSINWKCKVIKVYFIFRVSESTFAGGSRGFPICSAQCVSVAEWETPLWCVLCSKLDFFALGVYLVIWFVITA